MLYFCLMNGLNNTNTCIAYGYKTQTLIIEFLSHARNGNVYTEKTNHFIKCYNVKLKFLISITFKNIKTTVKYKNAV